MRYMGFRAQGLGANKVSLYPINICCWCMAKFLTINDWTSKVWVIRYIECLILEDINVCIDCDIRNLYEIKEWHSCITIPLDAMNLGKHTIFVRFYDKDI